ncbi:MAG TPA: methyltransferase domain-containing protein [Thermoanaerobaculia bacterium]|nr:methyltransferase domain-containing protein [Thermoanaerobaculia bacterium]
MKRLLRSAREALGLEPPAHDDPEAPVALTEEALGQALLKLDGGLGLFRLAHLLDAIRRAPRTRSLLSIGSGLGLQEAFIAVTHPGLDVVGVDLRTPRLAGSLPNLTLIRGDFFDTSVRSRLPVADFVFTVECLEHIEDDEAVVALMASKLAPGGRLYLQVPFASEGESVDPALCRREFEEHGHVRPGYSPERLLSLAGGQGLTVESVAAAYRFPLQPLVAAGVSTIPLDVLLPRWREILELIETDVRDGLAANRTEATAIKLLARREALPAG